MPWLELSFPGPSHQQEYHLSPEKKDANQIHPGKPFKSVSRLQLPVHNNLQATEGLSADIL